MGKRLLVLAVVFAAVLGAGALAYVELGSTTISDQDPLLEYSNLGEGLTLRYPQGFVQGQISAADRAERNMLLKLVRLDPPALVLAWKEEGLGVITTLQNTGILGVLTNNFNRRKANLYADYQQTNTQDVVIDGNRARHFRFSFQDFAKDYREQGRFTILVKGQDAYYTLCQAPVEKWPEAIESCEQIMSSWKFTR